MMTISVFFGAISAFKSIKSTFRKNNKSAKADRRIISGLDIKFSKKYYSSID